MQQLTKLNLLKGDKLKMGSFNINEITEFSEEKRVRKTMFNGSHLEVDLIFYVPDQSSPEHKHPTQDEVFYIVNGSGTMYLDGEPVAVKEKDVIVVPSGTVHGIKNTGSENLTVMFVKSKPKVNNN